jgi:DNA-binding transcriptional LysR family regulator
MNMRLSWDDLQVFEAAFRGGSFSSAARTLNLAQPTVRARIETLERSLGTVLFTRSASGLVPTEEAHAISTHIQTMARASEAVVRAASGPAGEISGVVRVSASEVVAAVLLPPMLVRLRHRFPGLKLAILSRNDASDLNAQEADIAIRMFPPAGENLIIKKLGAIRLGFFAHQSYVARKGLPQNLKDLLKYDLIGPDQARYDTDLISALDPALAELTPVLRSDSHLVQLAAIRAGAGIGVLQRRIAHDDPELVSILPDVTVAALDTWLVVHADLRRLPKVRATFDHLAEEFTALVRNDP